MTIINIDDGFFLACEDFARMFDHEESRSFFFGLFSSGDLLALTNSTLYARISPQWLSELRQLWPKLLDKLRVSCFRTGSHTVPGQHHSQPTPTSLGQGCMLV